MKRETLISGFVLLAIICGCNTKESVLPDFKDEVLSFTYPDTASFEFLRLENTGESSIGNIGEVLFDTGLVFVFDDKTKSVLTFDSLGNYLSKVAAIGRGPGQYTSNVRTFDLDRERKEIVIFDPLSRKILRFSYGGEFLRETPFVDYMGSGSFAYLGYDKYVFRLISSEEYWVVMTDSVGNVLSSFHPIESKFENLSSNPLMPQFFSKNSNNTPYYIPVWDDKIYQITHEGVKVIMDFNFSHRLVSTASEVSQFAQLQSVEKYSYFKDVTVAYPAGFYFETFYGGEMDGSARLGIPLRVIGTLEGEILGAGKFLVTSERFFAIKPYAVALERPVGNKDGKFVVSADSWFIRSRYSDQFPDADINDNPYLLFFGLNTKTNIN